METATVTMIVTVAANTHLAAAPLLRESAQHRATESWQTLLLTLPQPYALRWEKINTAILPGPASSFRRWGSVVCDKKNPQR